jgi:hypothetical protein
MLLDAQGLPHINIEQHKRLFNIITIENRIDEVIRLKERQRENELQYKCGYRIMMLKDKLKNLTENKEPKEIIENMLMKSQE